MRGLIELVAKLGLREAEAVTDIPTAGRAPSQERAKPVPTRPSEAPKRAKALPGHLERLSEVVTPVRRPKAFRLERDKRWLTRRGEAKASLAEIVSKLKP